MDCTSEGCINKGPIQKRINKEVGGSSSSYLIRKVGKNAARCCNEDRLWHQSSDSIQPAGQNIRMSKYLGRPGGGTREPKGGGVDIKHNSYDRRLRKLHGKLFSS